MTAFDEDRDAVEVDIAWVDHRARFAPVDDYEQWNLEVGLAVRMPTDAEHPRGFAPHPWINAGTRLTSEILVDPRKNVEVERIDGQPVELAIQRHLRYTFPQVAPGFEPARLAITRRFDLNDGTTVYLGVATVALAEPPPPGVYQIRLKPEHWWDTDDYRWAIDEDWHTFVLVDTYESRQRYQRVPWRDLPEE